MNCLQPFFVVVFLKVKTVGCTLWLKTCFLIMRFFAHGRSSLELSTFFCVLHHFRILCKYHWVGQSPILWIWWVLLRKLWLLFSHQWILRCVFSFRHEKCILVWFFRPNKCKSICWWWQWRWQWHIRWRWISSCRLDGITWDILSTRDRLIGGNCCFRVSRFCGDMLSSSLERIRLRDRRHNMG
jgi:hypothetical protein